MKQCLFIFGLLLLTGCRAGSPPAPESSGGAGDRVITLTQSGQPAPDGPRDAPAPMQVVFQVDVYQLAVPFGTFSGSESFWKRIDEQCIDPTTHDVLYKNGIRVGQASISELEFFRKFMDTKPVMSKLTTTATEAQNIELEMTRDLQEQTLAQFDAQNQLSMRDYDRCSNIINLSFQSAPRKPGQLRLSLCPVVRSRRGHFQFTQLNNETSIEYIAPVMLYDLNLRVDIPKDNFFVVMPSPEARAPTSVGQAFLTKEGHTERLEQILLIIPHRLVAAETK